MGKKGKWLGAVKKVFSPESKEKKEERLRKKLGTSAPNAPDLTPSASLEATTTVIDTSATLPPPPTVVANEEVKIAVAEAENEQSSIVEQSAAIAMVTSGMLTEETAAIKIQTAFRGYLARRALRALRGLVRLKSLIQGNSVKRQAASTLRCMQTLARVQSQIRSRRLKLSEENQALQRQLLLKRELESLRMGEEWDDSLQSKEQIEASLVSRQEAATRRERALAYAFSHQWKSSSRSVNPMFVDPNNPQWGWSWLERWMAARPWEGKSATDKATEKEANSDHMSVKSTSINLGEGEVMKSYNRRDSKPDKPSPPTPKPSRPGFHQPPSTLSSKVSPLLAKKKTATPKNGFGQVDDDSRSVMSMQSERPRRHSIAGSTVRDDESLASSPSVPSYMTPTESARAKSRFSPATGENNETPEKGGLGSAGSIKKRLSFTAAVSSPVAMRRHSGPPKVEGAVRDVEVQAAPESNGGSQ